MQRGAFLTAKVISLLKQGLAFRNISLALRIKYHLFSLQAGGIWPAPKGLATEEVCSQGCEQNPDDYDDDKQAQKH
jgi:hypothetical protein